MQPDYVARTIAVIAALAAVGSLVWQFRDRPTLRTEIDHARDRETGTKIVRARVWNHGSQDTKINSIAIWLGPPPPRYCGWLVRWLIRTEIGERHLHARYFKVQLEPDQLLIDANAHFFRLEARGGEAFASYDRDRVMQELGRRNSAWVMYARAFGPTCRAMSRHQSIDFLSKGSLADDSDV